MNARPADPFQEDHRRLLGEVQRLRLAAAEASELGHAEREVLVGHAVAFLKGQLVPHAEAEERVLYPAVAELLGAPEATAPMIHDHLAIRVRIAELEQADPRDLARLQELLYGLYALISVHFAKEEELYLPLLEQAGPELQHVLEALRELEHV
jgi:iron-sulfur cluster repair protein YtfE (RIC family)